MIATTRSSVLVGLEARPVQVTVEVKPGHGFEMVGLSGHHAVETRVRVRSALDRLGVPLFDSRVEVSVLPKHSSSCDLAIAVAALVAAGKVDASKVADCVFIGELSLPSAVRNTRGTIAHVRAAIEAGAARIIVPHGNSAEAAIVAADRIEVLTARGLEDVFDFLAKGSPLDRAVENTLYNDRSREIDLSDIRGNESVKRALEVAAAGRHNLLLIGPPGSGKTMFARILPGILPAMTREESIEVTTAYSVAGLMRDGVSSIERRPFRAPHHTASTDGLFGGGSPVRPGEVTLANNGVLFLDELPEFSTEALKLMSEAVRKQQVVCCRDREYVRFPARFQLVAAMNPCPCGFYGDPSDRCSKERIERYWNRVGPFLDMFDMCVTMESTRFSHVAAPPEGPTSEEIRHAVTKATARRGFEPEQNIKQVTRTATPEAMAMLESYSPQSARSAVRTMRVAKTIACLNSCDLISDWHVAEANRYRVFV